MIGDIIKVRNTDFLVLDENKNKQDLFVIALDTGIKTVFSTDERKDCYNNYMGSMLQLEICKWIERIGISSSRSRVVDLLTLDGYKRYGKWVKDVAPLTIDEYRAYADIIIPNIKYPFWLATGWGRPGTYSSNYVCFVGSDGVANYITYVNSNYCAPALWISKSDVKRFDYSSIPTKDLIHEVCNRLNIAI